MKRRTSAITGAVAVFASGILSATAQDSGESAYADAEPGVDAAINVATNGQQEVDETVEPDESCASPPTPRFTTIPACGRNTLRNVSRPHIKGNNGPGPACGELRDSSDYHQLIFLNLQAYRLINESRSIVARQMSCLLGVPVSPAHVTDALARMSRMLCTTSPQPNRDFAIGCDASGGAAASFEGGLPYDYTASSGFCGTIHMRPREIESIESKWDTRGTQRGRRLEQQAQGFADTIVHENLHALASFLGEEFEEMGASMSNPPNHCAVGPLINGYRYRCGSRNLGDPTARMNEIRYGNPRFDWNHYRPYADAGYLEERIQNLEQQRNRIRRRAEAIQRRREAGRELNERQTELLEQFETLEENLAESRRQLPCARAHARRGSGSEINRVLYDDPEIHGECGAIPSGRYRNEATARNLARMITGVRCENAREAFFGHDGVREPY